MSKQVRTKPEVDIDKLEVACYVITNFVMKTYKQTYFKNGHNFGKYCLIFKIRMSKQVRIKPEVAPGRKTMVIT